MNQAWEYREKMHKKQYTPIITLAVVNLLFKMIWSTKNTKVYICLSQFCLKFMQIRILRGQSTIQRETV